MKNFLSFIFAGIIGGLIAFGGIKYTSQSNSESAPENLSQQVSLINQSPTVSNFPGNFTDAAKKAMPVVVHIKATAGPKSIEDLNGQSNPFGGFFGEDFFGGSPQPQSGAGSGVFISSDGYIVTNNHVVSFAEELEVTTYDNRTYKAKVIGTDPGTDMAVIKIDATNMPTLNYGDSDKAQVGEWVLAVGNPFDLTSTVTAGIISAKGRSINILSRRGIESFIQTDAAVNPGNSGGALVDASGRLLGINTAIATQTGSYAGYSFAIPVNMMRKIVDDIIQYGSFQRAYLGISINQMDAELSNELGVDISQGVFVEGLADGGAASYAGILPRDIITAVDNRPIKTVPELQEVVGSAKVGDVLNVTINRKGKIKEIPVKLKAEQR